MSEALFQQAQTAAEQNDPQTALGLCRQFLKQNAGHIEGWLLLCRMQQATLQYDDWLASARKAVALAPKNAECHAQAAAAYQVLRNYYPAVQHFFKAHELAPQVAEYPFQMGVIMQSLARFDEAVQCYMKALTIDRTMVEAFSRMGTALADDGRYEEAILAFKRALKLKQDPVALTNLAIAYVQCGNIDEAITCYRQAMELAPNDPLVHGKYVFASNYLPQLDAAAKFALHQAWAEKYAPAAMMQTKHTNSHELLKRLRIGFVSRNFMRHPVATFLLPLLRHRDKTNFETYIYAFNLRLDDASEEIRSLSDHWRDVVKWTDEQIIDKIREDGIDILIDLSGHEYTRQMMIFARKPAPVQISWLGYFCSTAMPAMDYFISDPFSSPVGQEVQFSEKLVRLPHTRFCFHPLEKTPTANSLPAKKKSYITFGSFNRLDKLNAGVIALWSKVLAAVPNSKLLLKANALKDEATIERLKQAFAAHGVEAERLIFRPYSRHADLFKAYWDVDIALDPIPFTGCVTSLEGMWMGVPLVTLAGDSLVSRQGAALLENLDMQDWIASDENDYVRIAKNKSADLDALAATRKTLRNRMNHSPLTNGDAFARDMEAAWRNVWQYWCNS